MKCRNCDSEIEVNKDNIIKKRKGNPSYIIICPSCGKPNNVKCRHKTGKRKTVKISQDIP